MGGKNWGIFILISTLVAQATSVLADDAPVLQSAPTHSVFQVGDSKGWNPGVDFEGWAKGKEFYMGDILVFTYTKGEHNVIKVDEAAYKQCTIPDDPNLALASGSDNITLIAMGNIGFISGVGKDCENGLKLLLNGVRCPHTRPKPPALQGGRKLVAT